MKKELFFDRHSGFHIAALAEDGKLIELGLENESRKDIVGNIYKGKVVNVIESMNAAFIDCGLERNCYLSLAGTETVVDPNKYEGKMPLSREREHEQSRVDVKPGDEILVQALKNPRGTKGAKVTVKFSFVGKNLIYMPGTDFLGVSAKIEEKELRDNLLFTVDGMRKKGDGLIVRTVAPYATASRLNAEVAYLKNIYASVLKRAKKAAVGEVLYRECELAVRMLRDSFNDDIERIYVGDKVMYERLTSLIKMRPDFDIKNIELFRGERSMFSHYGFTDQIRELSGSMVSLPNGGNLFIERTEALTVIDVNTGKFVGDENLEDTVYATNIAAAREIARQVRLRDVGGIVVVDFIDMANERHKHAVWEELNQCLSRDRVKCRTLPMSEFCLVEFTRKRTSNGVASQLLQPCTHCKRSGYILSNEFIVGLLRAELLDKLTEGAKVVVVEMNRGVMEFLLSHRMMESDLARWKDRRVYLVPHRTYHEEELRFAVYDSEAGNLPDDAVRLSYK